MTRKILGSLCAWIALFFATDGLAVKQVDLEALQKHLGWCMKIHTSKPGQQGVVIFQPTTSFFRYIDELRHEFSVCQRENSEALATIASASDDEFHFALDAAIQEIEHFVTKHMQWVAYDRLRAADLLLAAENGDAAAIRTIFIYEQGANPEARANLKAVSDFFLLNLAAAL